MALYVVSDLLWDVHAGAQCLPEVDDIGGGPVREVHDLMVGIGQDSDQLVDLAHVRDQCGQDRSAIEQLLMQKEVSVADDGRQEISSAEGAPDGVEVRDRVGSGVGRDHVAQTVQVQTVATAGSNHGVVISPRAILQTDRTGCSASIDREVVGPHPLDHLGLEDGDVTEDADARTISQRQTVKHVQTSQWLSEYRNSPSPSTSTSPSSKASSTVSATSLAGELESRTGEVPVHVQMEVLCSQSTMMPTDPVIADNVVAMSGAPIGEVGGLLEGVSPE